MTRERYPTCARCPTRVCENRGGRAGDGPDISKAPAFCPMKLMPEELGCALAEYDDPGLKEFARLASVQEFQCYERLPDGLRTKLPRIEELIQFARKCGYQKLGLAHCGGLFREAVMLTEILESNGFEVVSVQCKTGAVPKERLGIRPEEKIGGPEAWETMCNPIAQAMVINHAGVDMAVMLGLCIGHDTLFIKYCAVPLTVLAVKDRVLGHNPLAALYLSDTYYHRQTGKID
ncbi:MAG TPA: DUF1847 domain-containing protein [Dehalococcoidales bacterium]|nr:MAG: hypothetical protein A2Z05_03625 [Chloroflexi bacterium RBG_16_60_22]HJX12354.1 DUF1847 domain-containing protein [Dehalococcoidales bacterium]